MSFYPKEVDRMVPLKEVTCFNPESGSRRLFVPHHVLGSDGDAGPQSEKLQRHSRDGEVDGRLLRSHRWDRVAFDGEQLSFTFFAYVIQVDLVDRPDIAEIRAILDREIEDAVYSPPPG